MTQIQSVWKQFWFNGNLPLLKAIQKFVVFAKLWSLEGQEHQTINSTADQFTKTGAEGNIFLKAN